MLPGHGARYRETKTNTPGIPVSRSLQSEERCKNFLAHIVRYSGTPVFNDDVDR